MSHICMSGCFSCHTIHVTHMIERVLVLISHISVRGCFFSLRMRHVTHMNEEAPENVFQLRTIDRMQEQIRDDCHAHLCRHTVCCSVL